MEPRPPTHLWCVWLSTALSAADHPRRPLDGLSLTKEPVHGDESNRRDWAYFGPRALPTLRLANGLPPVRRPLHLPSLHPTTTASDPKSARVFPVPLCCQGRGFGTWECASVLVAGDVVRPAGRSTLTAPARRSRGLGAEAPGGVRGRRGAGSPAPSARKAQGHSALRTAG